VKTLVVNLCDLGDVLLSTPLVEALARRHEVHYLVDESCAGVLAGHPGVARCWVLPRRDWRRRLADPAERPAALGESLAWAEELRAQGFEQAYSLQPQPLPVELAHLAGVGGLRGFIKSAAGGVGAGPEALVLQRHLQRFEARGDDGLHAAEGFLSLLPAEEVPANARLSFTVAPQAAALAAATMDGPQRGRGLVLGLLPGAGDASKRWSHFQWRSLLRAWRRRVPQGRAWVLGGPDDQARGLALAAGMPGIVSLCGKLSLGQTAAMLARCDLAVGGDTGPLHLAAAVGTPGLGLFGPTHPAESGSLLRGGLSLKPSSGCLDDLPARAVLWALLELTQGLPRRRCPGVGIWPTREAEGLRVSTAWVWAGAETWLARQNQVNGVRTLNAMAEAAEDRALRGLEALEGAPLALELAVQSAKVKVLWEEKP
jgi:heptosyltransferase-1